MLELEKKSTETIMHWKRILIVLYICKHPLPPDLLNAKIVFKWQPVLVLKPNQNFFSPSLVSNILQKCWWLKVLHNCSSALDKAYHALKEDKYHYVYLVLYIDMLYKSFSFTITICIKFFCVLINWTTTNLYSSSNLVSRKCLSHWGTCKDISDLTSISMFQESNRRPKSWPLFGFSDTTSIVRLNLKL